MNPSEFYQRVTALALYEQVSSEVNAGFVLNKVLGREPKESRSTIDFVRDTLNRFYLVNSQLLEKVGPEDWYLVTADRQQRLTKDFFNKLTPERALEIWEAQEQLDLRKIERSVS